MGTGTKTILGVCIAASALAGGCGTEEGEDAIEERQGALGAFTSWSAIPNGTFQPGNPALTSNGLNIAAFGFGGDSRVWSNFKGSAWQNNWTQLPNNGIVFATPPSAASLDFNVSGSVGRFALAEADSSGRFLVAVMNDNGSSIVQNWTLIPNGQFRGQPAIAATSGTAAAGPRSKLFLVGRGLDNAFYMASNTITNGTYVHGNWTGFSVIPNGTFQTAPAVTWACPLSSGQPVLMVAGLGFDNRLYVNRFNGSTWGGWVGIPNGTFLSKTPAIATSCGTTAKETMVFGLGMDSRVYFTRDSGTGNFAPSFTGMGTQTFADGPGAAAVRSNVSTRGFTVAARVSDGRFLSSSATVP